jgi:hypothetical protein
MTIEMARAQWMGPSDAANAQQMKPKTRPKSVASMILLLLTAFTFLSERILRSLLLSIKEEMQARGGRPPVRSSS